jgi:phosphotransferase system HPr (HPr) family protein
MKAEGEALKKVVREIEVEIRNADGLHMRPAMQFVDAASRFSCDIRVSNPECNADGKSIMQMTMLAATQGSKLTIRAEGADAEEAIAALRELVEGEKFGGVSVKDLPGRKNS